MFSECGGTKVRLHAKHATDTVSLGLQGKLPVLKRKAFELGLKTAVAAGAPSRSRVHQVGRKNYYYPDLPQENYQDSGQYDLP